MWVWFVVVLFASAPVWSVQPRYQAQPQETVNAGAAEHNNKGAQLANDGRLLEAVRAFRQAIQLVPDFVGAYYTLGRVYMQLKRYDDAAKAFAAAVQARPDYGDAWYQLGIALQMQKAFKYAGKAYLSALAYYPNDPDLLYRLGFVFIQEKDWIQAAHYWGRLYDEYPHHTALSQVQQHLPHLYFNLGTQHYANGAQKDAEKAFLKTVDLDPGYGAAFYNLGLVYRDLEQFNQSQSALENALDLQYDSLQVQSVLAHVYTLKGSLEDAEILFRRLLKEGKDPVSPHRGLVTVKVKQKDIAGALVEAFTVVAHAPRDAASFSLLAYVYEHTGNGERYGVGFQSDKAITAYKRAIRLDKNNVTPQFNLGILYGRLGDWEAAVKILKKAEETDPNHEGVKKWLPDVQARYDELQ
ncbi:MAG: tetratricopeptide repeat protein [Candidatus Latescibacteria bacterium]|nr:tetratricopeptide repeat protein [Candidatus Latescibacterota bacterium]